MSKLLKVLLIILAIIVIPGIIYVLFAKPFTKPAEAPTLESPTSITPTSNDETDDQNQTINIAAILSTPEKFKGEVVEFKAKFYGWSNSPSVTIAFENQSCVANRSDNGLDDGSGSINQNEAFLYDQKGTLLELGGDSPVQDVTVKAKVEMKTEKEVGMSEEDIKCVFLGKPE